MRPDVLASANVDGLAQLDGRFDHTGDLLGRRVLEAFLDKDAVGTAPYNGREDDPGPRIPCIVWRLTVRSDLAIVFRYLLLRRPRQCDR